MRNYNQKSENLILAAFVSGDGDLIGSAVGIASGDVENGAEDEILTCGGLELPKTSALAIDVGDELAAASIVVAALQTTVADHASIRPSHLTDTGAPR